jgi:oxygen-independent coproporphyrinogen-3 oxidase
VITPIRDAATMSRRLELLPRYEGRAPRYTSYPTAVQFTPDVGPETYGRWLGELPLDRPVSLYAHIPFCGRLCWFCGCNTRVVHGRESIDDYVAILLDEIAMVQDRLPGRLKVSNIHLGGGTPNMLSPDNLAALFGALRRVFDIEPDAEIAAELDPAQLTDEWVRAAVSQGLNRASLGVQDLSPAVQKAVNRHEPFSVVERAAGLLRDAGVEAINLDLMYGLPKQRTEDVLETLRQVLTLDPQRIALFGYAHVPWMKAHQKLIHDEDLPLAPERLEQSEAAGAHLIAEGYVAIGMDHFARPDDPLAAGSVHRNFQGYTTDAAQSLIGFGASAIGRLPQGFVQNQSAELAWRRAIEGGGFATARGVALTADDRFRSEIIERLMCDLSVDLDAVAARHGRSRAELKPAIERLAEGVADGVVAVEGGRVSVTELGRPFVRTVCAVFDAYVDPAAMRHSAAV